MHIWRPGKGSPPAFAYGGHGPQKDPVSICFIGICEDSYLVSLFEVCPARRRNFDLSRVVAASILTTSLLCRALLAVSYIYSRVASLSCLTESMTSQSSLRLIKTRSIPPNGFGNRSTKVSHNVVVEAPSAKGYHKIYQKAHGGLAGVRHVPTLGQDERLRYTDYRSASSSCSSSAPFCPSEDTEYSRTCPKTKTTTAASCYTS